MHGDETFVKRFAWSLEFKLSCDFCRIPEYQQDIGSSSWLQGSPTEMTANYLSPEQQFDHEPLEKVMHLIDYLPSQEVYMFMQHKTLDLQMDVGSQELRGIVGKDPTLGSLAFEPQKRF